MGLSWGFVWGPTYEFLVGARTISLKKAGLIDEVKICRICKYFVYGSHKIGEFGCSK